MAGVIYWAERETEIGYPEVGDSKQLYRHLGATYRVFSHDANLTIPLVNRWLYGLLSTDATVIAAFGTRLYDGLVPEGDPYPALVFQFMSGVPVSVVGGETIFTNMIYLVKGIVAGNSTIPIQAAMNRIDALIHRTEAVAVA